MAHTARLKVAVEAHLVVSDATRDALIALGWTPPTDTPASEPTGDLDITPYLRVHQYPDHTQGREHSWSWHCYGNGTCEGWTALDFTSRDHAERNARKHLADEHPDATLEQIVPEAREQQ